MEEIWKPLIYQKQEYPNFEISNKGNLRNANTKKVYKQCVNKQGYCQVCVSLGSRDKKKVFRIHKAVAETFIPNPENKPVPNHKDGNKLNNDVSNLNWATYSENTKHAFDNGFIPLFFGEENSFSKLTEEDIRYIRNTYIPKDREFGCRALAKKFGVSHQNISRIVNNKIWNGVK